VEKVMSRIDTFFGISKKGSTIKREMFAGLVTFLAMAYILAVNPTMLAGNGAFDTGMEWGSIFLATAISSGFTTILMGVVAKYPIALAPGMGLNAFFALTVCAPWGMNKSWQFALAAVLISGVIFVLISLTGVRKKVIDAIPQSLKYAVGAGIGFFIAFLGLKGAGIIYIDTAAALPALGSLSSPVMVLGLFGLFLTIVLMVRKVKGAIFFGIVATAVAGLIANFAGISLVVGGVEQMPHWSGFDLTFPAFTTFGAAFGEVGNVLTSPEGWLIIFSFLFVDFFDTAGTLMAVAGPAKLLNEKGELVNSEKALLIDAIGTVFGSVLGTSTVTSYIESAAGIEEGGCTGLTSVTTGVLFFASIILFPVLSVVTGVVTGPALIIVGILMASALKNIDWSDFTIAVPAFVTVIVMVLSYSISNGIAVGFFTYVVTMIGAGKAKKVHPIMYALAVLFAVYYIVQIL